MDLSPLNLPASVAESVELSPAEDFMLALLRDLLPDITVLSLIPLAQDNESYVWPHGIDLFILVRRIPSMEAWSYDERFVDVARISIQVFTKDPDGDMKGALVSEAVRAKLHGAANPPTYYPGLGSLVSVRRTEEAVRKTDWATATGPVQFADLPSGHHRYEGRYTVRIRRDVWSSNPTP